MIRLRVAPFALLALLATPAFADQTERLRFAAEANRAEVAARLEGAEGRDFLVAALAGQRMTVEMTTTVSGVPGARSTGRRRPRA